MAGRKDSSDFEMPAKAAQRSPPGVALESSGPRFEPEKFRLVLRQDLILGLAASALAAVEQPYNRGCAKTADVANPYL